MKKLQCFARVWALCKPYQLYILASLVFMIVWQVLASIQPIMLGRIVTAVTDRDTGIFISSILIWTGLALGRALVFYSKEWFEIRKIEFDLSRHLSRISMKKFFSISMGQHHLGHSVIKRNVIAKGESATAGIVFSSVYELVPTSLMILLPTVFLLVNAWQVGVCVLVAISVFVSYTVLYNNRFIPRIRSLDTLSNRISKKHGEVIANADVVYVNAQEERVRLECDEENAKNSTEGVPMWCSYISWFYAGQWGIWISQALCMALAGYLAFVGKIGTGKFVTISLWIMSSLGTLANISHIQRNLAKNIGPVIKYFRYLDYEPDIVIPSKPVPIDNLRGRIEFRHVGFTYRPRTDGDALNDADAGDDEEGMQAKSLDESTERIPALRDVSFTLDEGKFHAIVGKSGAGKSTLVSLILRAYDPQEGHILIDGVDLRMIDYRALRRRIGLVPQDVSLFDGTLKYNVTFGLNGSAELVNKKDLDNVLQLSRMSEFFEKMEQGWDTIIGERGIKLSGGQRQRVGIARALIKDPQIMIFDEATSSLDTESEGEIRQSIREASQGRTTLVIAHRLATVVDADKIFVMDDGRVVGEGSHEELLTSNEYYVRLVRNQVIKA